MKWIVYSSFCGALLLALSSVTGCPMNDDAAPAGTGGSTAGTGGSTTGTGGGSTGTGGGASGSGSGGAAAPASTHEGTISIQDRTIHGVPQAGHGLSVLIDFSTAWRRPDLEDMPGSPLGCKVWLFDAQSDPAPAPAGDVGVVSIAGTTAPIPHGCAYEAPSGGFVCAATSGDGRATVKHAGTDIPPGAALFEIADARFEPDDRGRYLDVTAEAAAAHGGLYPILRVLSPTSLLVFKATAADSDGFAATYRTRAGAGTTPGLPHEMPGDPLRNGDRVSVGIQPAGGAWFRFPTTTPIPVGGSFSLDTASATTIAALPADGSAFSIGCGGAGGACEPAQLSILRILTTDGDTANLSPFAMPPARRKQVEVSCVEADGDGIVEVPAAIARFLRTAHEAKPITRIRTAFMRNGFVLATNPPPQPPNVVRVVVGHQVIAFGRPR